MRYILYSERSWPARYGECAGSHSCHGARSAGLVSLGDSHRQKDDKPVTFNRHDEGRTAIAA